MNNPNFKKGMIADFGYEEYKGKETFYLVLQNDKDQNLEPIRGKGLEEAFNKVGNLQKGDIVNLKDFGIDEETKKRIWEIERHEPYKDLSNEIIQDTEPVKQKNIDDVIKEVENAWENKKERKHQDFEYIPDNIKNNYVGVVKNRFMSDEKINYYDKNDKGQINIAFEDRKNSLNTSRQDEKTIHAMLDLAESKSWTAIKLKGTEEFKQKAWLEAQLRGIEVKGYTPNEKDLIELQIKQAERTTNQVEMKAQKAPEPKQEQKAELEKDQAKTQQTLTSPTLQKTIYQKLQNPIADQAYLDRIGKDFEGAEAERGAINRKEAQSQAENFIGQELVNMHSGIKAIISNKNISKMTSGKAFEKSSSEQAHWVAVANADKLFENSIFGWQYQDRNEDINIDAIHRAIAPMKLNNEIYLAKLTIKELAREEGNRVYSVEAVEIENEKSPIPIMTHADQDKQGFTQHRSNRALIDILVQNAQEYNKEYQKNIDNLQNNNKDQRKSSSHKNLVTDIPAYHILDNKIQDKAYLQRIGTDFKGAKVDRTAINFNETKENAQSFTGKELTNFHSGIKATVSRNALDKMLSEKAYEKSVDLKTHLIAVSNADKLFENSVFGWKADHKNNDRNADSVHRAIAPINIDDKIYLAKLTIKEFTNEVDGNRVYSVEAIELENEKSPIPEMVADDIKYNARTDRLNGALIEILVQNAQEYNKEHRKNIDNLQNNNKEPKNKEPEKIDHQKSAKELKQEIKTIIQDGYKNGTIKSRDDLVATLKEMGYAVKENEKSISIKNPNGKNIRLEGELFTKNYHTLKSLNENLQPEKIKENYPKISDENIAKIDLWRDHVLSKFDTVEARQNALRRLNNVLPDIASGKLDLGYPRIPANEIKPEIEVRVPDSGDQSRSR